MALSRRTGQRFQASIWPGFVDAMTALLLVLMFVLTIFMVIQFFLRQTITGQESELDDLNAQIISLADALGLEKQRAAGLEGDVARLNSTLDQAKSEADAQAALIATLTLRTEAQASELEQKQAAIASFEAQVATLLAERDTARNEGAALADQLSQAEAERAKLISQQEALQLALAKARNEVSAQEEAARLAAARREALDALVADLRGQVSDKEQSLADALARLEGESGRTAELVTRLAAAQSDLSEAEKARLAEAAAAQALRERLAGVESKLSEEEAARLADSAAAEALREKLKNADVELTAMTLALEKERKKAEETLTLLAAAKAAQDELSQKLKITEQDAEAQFSEAERRAALLATAQQALSDQELLTAEQQRKVAVLNQQVAALRKQLGGLQELLDESAARDAESKVQLQALGAQLNTALARVAAEEKRRRELEEAERKRLEEESARLAAEAQDLERYKSEFFGRLRDVLATQEGVRVVGDRFVFSSEVLFSPASAVLSEEGKAQIARIAAILRQVSDKIPPEINWIVRVDGHTDNVPLSGTGRYHDNWELSQGRALSVVRYMIDELGFPPNRLAANGFGEYQPINPANTPQARAQNRRIELKLTER